MFKKKKNKQIENNFDEYQKNENDNAVQDQPSSRNRGSFPWWVDVNHMNPFVAIGIFAFWIIIAILTKFF